MSKKTKTLLWLTAAIVAVAGLLLARLDLSGPGGGPAPGAPAEALAVEILAVEPHRLVERFATVGTIRADERSAR